MHQATLLQYLLLMSSFLAVEVGESSHHIQARLVLITPMGKIYSETVARPKH